MKMPAPAGGRQRTKKATASAKRTSATKSIAKKSRTKTQRSSAQRVQARPAARKRNTASTQQKKTGASAQTTTDHDTIRDWVEARGGSPASVKGTQRGRQHAGLLRIDFPGYSGEQSLEHIDWDEWFQKFDQSDLQFLYQEKTAEGEESRFFKLVRRKK